MHYDITISKSIIHYYVCWMYLLITYITTHLISPKSYHICKFKVHTRIFACIKRTVIVSVLTKERLSWETWKQKNL